MTSRCGWLFALLTLACSCANLPTVERNTCGNAIVDRGEDCDSFAPKGSSCGQPASTNPCRFVCTDSECPDGFGCGDDGVCRQFAGTFEPTGATFPLESTRLQLADFDGDGTLDVLGSGSYWFVGSPAVNYLGSTGQIASYVLPGFVFYASPTNLDESTRSSLTFQVALGVGAMVGRADRSVSIVAYSSISLPKGVVGLPFLTKAHSPYCADRDNNCGTVLLLVSRTPNGYSAQIADDSGNGPAPLVLFKDAASLDLAGSVTSAPLWNDSLIGDCDEFLVPFVGEQNLYLYSACIFSADGSLSIGSDVRKVKLPNDDMINTGAVAGDLNGDGHLDLLIGGMADIYAAYGDGKGAFSSDPNNLDSPDNLASTFRAVVLGAASDVEVGADQSLSYPCIDSVELSCIPLPLTLGDVNDDGIADFVMNDGVYVSLKIGPQLIYMPRLPAFGAYYTAAIMGDFNGNGTVDVALGSSMSSGVAFFNGDGGGGFSYSTIPTVGSVSELVAGDFDGDLMGDLAISEMITKNDGTRNDALSIAYGRAASSPNQAAHVGRFDSIIKIGAARLGSFTLTEDMVDDLIVLSDPNDNNKGRQAALLIGGTDRQPVSYLGLQNKGSASNSTAIVTIGGAFTDEKTDAIAAVGADVSDSTNGSSIRLWLSQSSGQAELSDAVPSEPIDTKPFDSPDVVTMAYDPSGFAIGHADLNNDGRDEVVLVLPANTEKTEAVIVVASAVKGANGWHFVPQASRKITASLGGDPQLHLVDLDGDGLKDLVLLGSSGTAATPVFVQPASSASNTGDSTDPSGSDNTGGSAGSTPDDSPTTSTNMWVFWNDGKTNFSTTAVTPAGAETTVYSVAPLTSAKGSTSLALAVEEGVTIASPKDKPRADGFALKSLDVKILPWVLVAGDIDHDGIDDLILGDGQVAQLYLGKAKNQ